VNDIIQKYKDSFLQFWQPLEKGKKTKLIIAIILLIVSLSIVTTFATKTKYELVYVDLNEKDAGNVVKKLEEMGLSYQLSSGGRNISVPEASVDKVKITLAQEEVLNSGSFYSKFWDSASWGMTDSQFSVLERGAIEEEIKGLIINGITGINDAQIMITMPKEKVFASDNQQKSTASVILNVEPGTQLTPNQVKSIYNLISKSVPNLPIENITIVNQYSESLDYLVDANGNSNISGYDQQLQIQKDFQDSIKKEIERMLGRVLGPDKVVVTVFAKMNFDQERTTQNIVEPIVDGKGLPVSVEKIQENYTGDGGPQSSPAGTGSSPIPNYPSSSSTSGNYERAEDRINYEINRITKEVVKSPYQLEDLSVNIVYDPPMDPKTNQPDQQKTDVTTENIMQLIRPIVLAAVQQQGNSLNGGIDQKIAVVPHEFKVNQNVFEQNSQTMPNNLLLYGLIGLSILAIGGFGFRVISRRRKNKATDYGDIQEQEKMESKQSFEFDFTPTVTEEAALREEIQKLAQQKPEEFVKLIRTWLSDE